jgi:uncharacterized repeat protein (TIGR04076 family)
MSQIKISVLRKMTNDDFAEEYCLHGLSASNCPTFQVGQEFLSIDLEKPQNFCNWAWDDIFKYVSLMHCGGNMGDHMKYNDTIIACCTDGIRPVVFRIDKME